MSSKFAGVTFDEQPATPSDDAIIRRAILDDGILTGCEFSYTGSTLTMTAGQLMICGRQVKHPSTQNWAVADATTGFARLLLTIDLTRTSSKDTFEQVVDTIEYASAVDGFADLVQDDINASGTKYQIVAAVVSLASGGISGIVSQLSLTSASLGDKSVIIVKAPSGSTVTCSKGDIIKRTLERNGEWRFNGLDLGTWRINSSKNGLSTYTDFKITEFGVYRVELYYQLYPDDFDWSEMGTKGVDYEIVQDDDTPIPVGDYRKYKNWKARVLTSGFITALKYGYIDVFAVGGGGGSTSSEGSNKWRGEGGELKTSSKMMVSAGQRIEIVIGAGGTEGDNPARGQGGTTSGFGVSARGGYLGYYGPPPGSEEIVYNSQGGYEFGAEAGLKLYGNSKSTAGAGARNSGEGGCNNGATAYNGGSGIIVFRNTREVS